MGRREKSKRRQEEGTGGRASRCITSQQGHILLCDNDAACIRALTQRR